MGPNLPGFAGVRTKRCPGLRGRPVEGPVLEDTAATTAPPAPHCRCTADVVSVRTLHVLLDFFVFTTEKARAERARGAG